MNLAAKNNDLNSYTLHFGDSNVHTAKSQILSIIVRVIMRLINFPFNARREAISKGSFAVSYKSPPEKTALHRHYCHSLH